ncbi:MULTISPECIES: cytidylyltransferase domain-containing protein [Pseudoalteromonas]|uniref:Spore coat polysaccharide biosynthesis-like protein n=1 Tax=Pseudoalteromonas luteoviolacea (strain 2ta16) TaxID=1353533 RepID=V4HL00_PSEL2|nr:MULTISPECIES: glycosyltransferase family protein [Pseudoalteromonas]ESP90428.1 Spore coat polysaccharide biosynthesis-like protein [Pseudoalteromonas luteoviolacea 2ta16]MCG7549864.1 glycosyltransferase family protein [Pseudoalteromonas sp. Of7M-16]
MITTTSMENVQIIIQARMTSTRLAGKVLLPLCNSTVLQVMLQRLNEFKDHIVIATTNDGSEAPIVELCKKNKIKYYQGSTEDVLSRYYEAATLFGATDDTTIVRLTSDCPLIDPQLTRQVIEKHRQSQYDVVNLGPHSGYPRGLDCTAFSYQLLKKTHLLATSAPDREHVTLGMAKFCSISTYSFAEGESLDHWRLTLDEPDDYTAIKAIYAQFGDNLDFSYLELKKQLKEKPELTDINKHVSQKTV